MPDSGQPLSLHLLLFICAVMDDSETTFGEVKKVFNQVTLKEKRTARRLSVSVKRIQFTNQGGSTEENVG